MTQEYVKFQITNNDAEVLRAMIKDFTYVQRIDEQFDAAINDLLKHDFIGLCAEDVENEQNGRLTLIGISTPYKIYVMNLKTMGEMDIRLREMLTSYHPIKVVHDASRWSDNLYHSDGLKLKGVFDTMISHNALGYSHGRTTLRECITEHMVLPFEFGDATDCGDVLWFFHIQLTSFYQNIFKLQDCVDAPVKSCSGSVAILLKFHDFLTEKLLKNVYASFSVNTNYSRNEETVEVGVQYAYKKEYVKRLEAIPPFKLNDVRTEFESDE